MRLGVPIKDGRRVVFRESAGRTDLFPSAEDIGEFIQMPGWRERTGVEARTVRNTECVQPLRAPRKIVCVGLNYHAHAAEVGKATPEHPTLFAKFATTLCGPEDPIRMPPTTRFDWEAELAIVMGADVSNATAEQARDAILGYTVINDLSARDWQNRTSEWLQGKNFDGTTPIGPVIVTSDELDPAEGLAIECFVDDEVVQSGSTADMIFSPVEIVEYVSRIFTLQAGDVIATGTPAGVGFARIPPRYLAVGSVVETTIQNIGTLRNPIIA